MPSLVVSPRAFRLDPDSFRDILGRCSIPTLTRLRSTCHLADAFVAEEIEFRYSKELRTFVDDPRGFRDVLNDTGSIISGSFAIALAGEVRFPPGDLDVYTTEAGVGRLLTYLKDVAGYLVLGDGYPHMEDYGGGAKHLIHLIRGSLSMDVIVSLTQSPTLPIAFFWSTPVMLFLTADAVSIAYPSSFEKGLGLINPGRLPFDDVFRKPLLAKYASRGFRITDREVKWYPRGQRPPPCAGPRSPTCPVNVRHFGDRLSLHLSLKALSDRLRSPAFSGTVATLTTVWWRGGSGCGGPCNLFGDTEFAAWTQDAEMVGL